MDEPKACFLCYVLPLPLVMLIVLGCASLFGVEKESVLNPTEVQLNSVENKDK